MEFPQLTMSMPDGREESIMKRTCLVGGFVGVNTHNLDACLEGGWEDALWGLEDAYFACVERHVRAWCASLC